MKELITLFTSFFKVGIMTFGGGYAMLPMLERELVDKKKYVTIEEIMDYYAVGQCTPGVIAVNVATFIGYKCSEIKDKTFANSNIKKKGTVIKPKVAIIAPLIFEHL